METKLKINNKTSTITMIKNYQDFINEDLRNKNITLDISYINLARLYPDIHLKYNDDLKIGISSNTELRLNNEFYEALENDHINKDDIAFENCKAIVLYNIPEFTKVSDYGKFGENIKEFDCSYCENLTSIQGSPEIIEKDFDCSNCKQLTNLKGGPKEVSGDFDCYGCKNITSLDGSPKKVGGYFGCGGCSNLTSLDGAPEEVGKGLSCSDCENLTSLDGAPEEVGGDFDCTGCKNLTSLEFAPKKVGGDFYCHRCDNLTSLDGAPEIIGDFSCFNCDNLTSLDGAPETVVGTFVCRNCNPDFIELAIEKYGSKVKS